MTAFALILAAAFVAVLAVMSRQAARGLPRSARLPMQWGFDGRPTWRAPRDLALAFTPTLAAITLFPTALLSLLGEAGQGLGSYFGVLGCMGVAWVAAHALHLWLVARWRRAEGV
ncbi:hypothetical protein [Brevundimonas naejangsanensis]|uniref:hypothetical protein n=1 Tax=Brevundimonas naejangsanensis TaxID=588932 RepID=UPI0026EA7E8A|nr:hypothetical protein [Brevundimonas naejangsanensis]